LGKIRLGIKKIIKGRELPSRVDYFVCPPEVQKIYGEKPKEIDVMFLIENEEVLFPQTYKWYSSSCLRCKGDGEVATRRVRDLTEKQKKDLGGDFPSDENALVEVACPCEMLKNGCGQVGNLMALLPKVSMAGVYQIDTTSFHNIIRLNSAFEYIRGMVGRISMVPLKLRRTPEIIEYKGKKTTHHLLSLVFDRTLEDAIRLRDDNKLVLSMNENIALPAPVEDGPEPTGEPPKEIENSYVTKIVNAGESPDGGYQIEDSEGSIMKTSVEIARRAYKMRGQQVRIFYSVDGNRCTVDAIDTADDIVV
jgi:hypothetical protein